MLVLEKETSILSMDKPGEQKSLGRLSFTVHLMFGLAEASAVTDNLGPEGKRPGHSALTKSASCGLERKSRSILFMENPIVNSLLNLEMPYQTKPPLATVILISKPSPVGDKLWINFQNNIQYIYQTDSYQNISHTGD